MLFGPGESNRVTLHVKTRRLFVDGDRIVNERIYTARVAAAQAAIEATAQAAMKPAAQAVTKKDSEPSEPT